jgi:hypothetical protein
MSFPSDVREKLNKNSSKTQKHEVSAFLQALFLLGKEKFQRNFGAKH